MDQQKEGSGFPIPINLLILDMAGALLAGIGLAKHFANIDIIPAPARFENYGLIFTVAGFALMIPMLLHILNRARTRAEATEL